MAESSNGRTVSANRHDEEEGAALRAVETLRSVEGATQARSFPAKGEDRLSIFWRVFGGTLLSIAALVAITLYQQFTSALAEIRANVDRLHEGRADLVKTEDFNSRVTTLWTSIKELQTGITAFAAFKERSALLEQQMKTIQEEHKELVRELQLLRDRQAVLEGRLAGRSGATPNLSAEK
jgi:hypothetical protein